ATLAVRGTISGEHGDGFSRTPFISKQYGELTRLFRELKRIFDPHNILNPGKVVGDDPTMHTRNLRPTNNVADEAPPVDGEAPPRQVVELHLDWNHAEIAQAARNCNGC